MSLSSITIPAGGIIIRSVGAHSEYMLRDAWRTTVELDEHQLLKMWAEKYPSEAKGRNFNPTRLYEWLFAMGHITRVPAVEWWFDSRLAHLEHGLNWSTINE